MTTQTAKPTTEAKGNGVKDPSRANIRTKIFNNRFKSEEVEAWETTIEIRQPSLGQVLTIQESADGSSLEQTLNMVIEYCYVPGTNERVFDEADKEILRGLPFDSSLTEVVEAITRLTGIDIKEEVKNLKPTLTDTTS